MSQQEVEDVPSQAKTRQGNEDTVKKDSTDGSKQTSADINMETRAPLDVSLCHYLIRSINNFVFCIVI